MKYLSFLIIILFSVCNVQGQNENDETQIYSIIEPVPKWHLESFGAIVQDGEENYLKRFNRDYLIQYREGSDAFFESIAEGEELSFPEHQYDQQLGIGLQVNWKNYGKNRTYRAAVAFQEFSDNVSYSSERFSNDTTYYTGQRFQDQYTNIKLNLDTRIPIISVLDDLVHFYALPGLEGGFSTNQQIVKQEHYGELYSPINGTQEYISNVQEVTWNYKKPRVNLGLNAAIGTELTIKRNILKGIPMLGLTFEYGYKIGVQQILKGPTRLKKREYVQLGLKYYLH